MRTRTIARRSLWLAGLALVVTGPALAQTKGYEAHRLEGKAPKIDGRTNDGAWKKAAWDSSFTSPGGPAAQKTEFSILYDDAHLYVGLRLYDDDAAGIVKKEGEKDDVNGDRVAVFFTPKNDAQGTYVFVVNAAGVMRDQFGEDGQNWDNGFDAHWTSAVHVDGKGWFAEMKIPLDQMDLQLAQPMWGLQLTRMVERVNMPVFWSPFNPAKGFTGSFGQLHGVRMATGG